MGPASTSGFHTPVLLVETRVCWVMPDGFERIFFHCSPTVHGVARMHCSPCSDFPWAKHQKLARLEADGELRRVPPPLMFSDLPMTPCLTSCDCAKSDEFGGEP